MAENGPVATTGIDSLVSYLKEHGETDSVSLAMTLKVGEAVIEQWANALEKANLLKISYKMGKMYLSIPELSGEQAESVKKTLEAKQGTVSEDIESQLMLIKGLDQRIAALSTAVANGELEFKKSGHGIKKNLDILEETEKRGDEVYKKIIERKEHANKNMEMLSKELSAMEEMAKRIKEFDTSMPEIDRLVADTKSRIASTIDSVNALPKMFENIVKDERNKLNNFIASTKDSLATAENAINEWDKLLAEKKTEIEQYKRQAENINMEVKRERTKILDEISTEVQEIEKLSKIADEAESQLKGGVSITMDKYGDAAKLYKELNELKDEISKINAEKESIRKELDSMKSAVGAIHILGSEGIYSKSTTIEQYNKKSKNTQKKLGSLSERVNKIEEKIKKGKGDGK